MKTVNLICNNCSSFFQKSIYEYRNCLKRGYKNFYCSNICSCEFNRKKFSNLCSKSKHEEEYLLNPKTCLNCQNIISYDKRKNKYCSSTCSAFHTQRNGGHKSFSDEDKKILSQKVKEFYKNNPLPKTGKYIDCPACGVPFYKSTKLQKICCSRKCSNEWIVKSGYFKNKGRGGYRPNSGTSKKGWYKGFYCGSSWELAWVIYNLEHGVAFKRNEQGFDYVFEDKARKYYPDFVVGDEYIEIKGYHSKQFDAKVLQFPFKLNVLHKNELKPILDYVISKYGKNFVEKYE
jgi:hypothetical protein